VSLFGGQIVAAIENSDDDNITTTESIRRVVSMELIALSMSIPAMILSIYCLRWMTIKNLQIAGFGLILFCFMLLGGLFNTLKGSQSDALFGIYCLLLFSLSFGPNLSTFILPSQVYPKDVRATFNGVSAACGKLGAFAGVYVFGPVADASSYTAGKAVVSCVALCCAVCITQRINNLLTSLPF
jgi:PHS family inorganic phosphate transporter-like MFS transporter